MIHEDEKSAHPSHTSSAVKSVPVATSSTAPPAQQYHDGKSQPPPNPYIAHEPQGYQYYPPAHGYGYVHPPPTPYVQAPPAPTYPSVGYMVPTVGAHPGLHQGQPPSSYYTSPPSTYATPTATSVPTHPPMGYMTPAASVVPPSSHYSPPPNAYAIPATATVASHPPTGYSTPAAAAAVPPSSHYAPPPNTYATPATAAVPTHPPTGYTTPVPASTAAAASVPPLSHAPPPNAHPPTTYMTPAHPTVREGHVSVPALSDYEPVPYACVTPANATVSTHPSSGYTTPAATAPSTTDERTAANKYMHESAYEKYY